MTFLMAFHCKTRIGCKGPARSGADDQGRGLACARHHADGSSTSCRRSITSADCDAENPQGAQI